jgi:hypothetical protein
LVVVVVDNQAEMATEQQVAVAVRTLAQSMLH